MKFYHPIVAAVAVQFGMNLKSAEQFIAGIIKGVVEKDDLSEIEQCFKNAEEAEYEIEKALSDFSKMTWNDILNGIEDVAVLINELPEDLKDCKAMQGDIKKVEDWAKNLDVKKIPGNVLKHMFKIKKDIGVLEDDWKNEQYEKAGEDVVDILNLALGVPTGEEEDVPEAL